MPTLDLRNSTLQELFDAAVAGLRGQGCQPAMDDGKCQYRTPAGLKCALGHLIPDDVYDPKWDAEGYLACRLVEEGHIKATARQEKLISFLQRAHDDCTEFDPKSGDRVPLPDVAELMEQNLKDVADDFNLVYTPPEEKKS